MRDLSRFGSTVLHDGCAPSGEQVVSPAWIEDAFTGGGPDVERHRPGRQLDADDVAPPVHVDVLDEDKHHATVAMFASIARQQA